VSLREYQREALDSAHRYISEGERRLLVALPTGTGKCISPDSWVWSRGLKRFGEVWGSDRIAGPHQTDRVIGWYDDGVNDGYRISTELGLEIDGTKAHPLWIRREDGFEGWVRLEDVRVGDYVAVARGRADFGETQLDFDSAYALGLLIADGCLITKAKSSALQLDGSPEILSASVVQTLQEWRNDAAGQKAEARVMRHHRSAAHDSLLVSSPVWRRWFKSTFGFKWTYSHLREVPRAVAAGTRSTIAAFILGYLDGDGTVGPNNRHLSFTTTSPALAEQIQLLLLGLGVLATKRARKTSGKPAWNVFVNDIVSFVQHVGLPKSGQKRDRLLQLAGLNHNTNIDVVPGLGKLLRTIASTVPAKWKTEDFRNIEAYYSPDNAVYRRPSYPQLTRWLEAAPPSEARATLARIVYENRAWTRIVSKDASAVRRIDCEVADSHTFVANGIVNHNTRLFCAFVQELDLKQGEIALAVAHSDDLISQAADSFREAVPGAWVDVEKGAKRASPFTRIVVGSVQTLKGKRLAEFLERFRRKIRVLIIDEAHRAASKTYRELIDAVLADREDCVLLGVTATPKRTDNVGLGTVFNRVAYSMTIEQAVERGYLCPLKAYQVETSVSLDEVNVTSSGELNPEQLAKAVDQEIRNRTIVDGYLDLAFGKKAIVFAASVPHAQRIAELFNAAGVRAEAAWGELPIEQRRQMVARFRRGETMVLANFGLYLEGFDVADTEVVIHGRPTKSGVVYTQATGRITRPHPTVAPLLGKATTNEERRALIASSPKPYGIVIDVVDVTRQHTLQSLPSLFGLPPRLNVQGRSITDAAQKYQELSARDPGLAVAQVDISAIETKLREVDVFAVPTMPREIGTVAHLAWFEAERGCRYGINLPPLSFARREDGERIEDFDWVLRCEIERVRREVPDANPIPIALRRLRVVDGSRSTVNVSFEVIENPLGEFELRRSRNGDQRGLGAHKTLAAAIGACENLIREYYPHAVRALSVDASWQNEAISPKQTRLLRKLGTPEQRIPKTRGEASRLIEHIRSHKEVKSA
jgi:superfamily II DNA or RNA helicase